MQYPACYSQPSFCPPEPPLPHSRCCLRQARQPDQKPVSPAQIPPVFFLAQFADLFAKTVNRNLTSQLTHRCTGCSGRRISAGSGCKCRVDNRMGQHASLKILLRDGIRVGIGDIRRGTAAIAALISPPASAWMAAVAAVMARWVLCPVPMPDWLNASL